MKWPFFPSLLITISALAQPPEMLPTDELKRQYMTVVKDTQVEKLLSQTSQFNDCRTKYNEEVKKAKSPADRDLALKAAEGCFNRKLNGQQDPEQLKKLSEQLQLEEYQLVKSNTVKEITDYLSSKLIKSLTGRDPNEKDPLKIRESMKFKNQKQVDQATFVELYKTMLNKTALLDLSKYCFENLRKNVSDKSPTTFAKHWTLADVSGVPTDSSSINDQGEPRFDAAPQTLDNTKKEDVYATIVNTLDDGSGQMDPKLYEAYFSYCQGAIPVLCQKFKSSTASAPSSGMTNGAASCLMMDKLRSIREALANTDKVSQQFKEMGDDRGKLALVLNDPVNFYRNGQNKDEESLDQLSSFASSDFLQTTATDEELKKKKQTCDQTPSAKECKDFLVESDAVQNTENNIAYQMELKKKLEIMRAKAIDKAKLKDYLESLGYFELAKKAEDGTLGDIATELEPIFEAKKRAALEALKQKMGKRQMSKDDLDNVTRTDPTKKDQLIKDNVSESASERRRLAQVVLFNNIITSQLTFKDSKTKKDVGRNVSGWKKEEDGMKGMTKINDKIFENIKKEASKDGATSAQGSIVGNKLIDQILGKVDKD